VTERHTLIAFLATLVAIVILVVTGALMAANGKPAEALGIGGAVTGLIGVIGTFKPRTPTGDSPQPVNVVNPPDDPANVQETSK
jgi:hypothetical protein